MKSVPPVNSMLMPHSSSCSELFEPSRSAERTLCEQIRVGISQGEPTETVAALASQCYDTHIMKHLEQEKMLMEALPAEDQLKKRAYNKHKRLRSLKKKLRTLPKRKDVTLSLIEEELQGHLSFETRELFPHLDACVSDETWEQVEQS